MINIERNPEVPVSLATDEVRDYIDKINLHLEDTANPKPEPTEAYRTSDLLQAFDRDFFKKCYLTEELFANSWAMDVEHFTSKATNPELRYEWTNLYPATHLANMLKPRNSPNGGYLDPCDPNDDVENDVIYTLSAYGEEPNFTARDNGNIKAKNTVLLLNRVHNGHDDNTINSTKSLRHAIHKKYIEILNKIVEWQKEADGTQEKFQLDRDLKDLLSRKSAFTMLCRSMPAVRKCLPENFLD